MKAAVYSEDALVEQPAIALLAELGWQTVNANGEFDHGVSTLGPNARVEVRVTIEKLLDQGLSGVYTPELFEQKTTAVFQHVFDACFGAGRSIHTAA